MEWNQIKARPLVVPLLGDLPSYLTTDDLCSHVRLNDVTLAHVTNTEQQAGHPVPVADDSILREQKRLGTLLWARQLRKHDAHHKCLNEHAGYALQGKNKDTLGTLFRYVAISIA